ncbi:endonuclease domain-containing 1 protein-like [Hemibagrus wyckioides]|uniref:endonuclease domain-containing 1 protein-like n=1 Tax=Hemibagrus wyckioides TaxID=337641 RepID=UPI00266BA06E|nr:endonuclease domain-containing 1 protein-like [Hemibagrus wyckioides]
MWLLCLFTSIVLRALTGEAKVADNFSECSQYFYKSTEPSGMDQNAKKICQMYGYGGFYYATLYSVHHRIPLYSAYMLDHKCTTNQGVTTFPWHIEPQISNINEPKMVRESESDKNSIKRNQAISSDYAETGYDRGHLNPKSFQCSEGREATFTLTNVAPMDACFNRIYWKNCESNLRKILMDQLKKDNYLANVYLVTGTVLDQNLRIPQSENSQESQRVTVPSHIWTAVCYKHNFDDKKSFSFGYIGKNEPETSIIPMSIVDLNSKLNKLYSFKPVRIKIFVNDCFTGSFKSKETEKMFLNKLSEKQRLKVTPEVKNTYLAVKRLIDSGSLLTNLQVIWMSARLKIGSLPTYFTMVEELKNMESACLITTAKKSIFPAEESDLRKRDVFEQSESVECQVVPEKSVAGWQTAADGSPCQSVSDSSLGCNCITENKKNKPCCSSPCLYQQEQKGYWCYSGQSLIQCSPQYSLITFKGERCNDNHPCATYGYDYYWCQKASGSWDYCSPPLWRSKAKDGKYCRNNHACAKYGKSDPYCYTDDNKKKACCISDDCFSAVNGKTCKSDNPCGYHGYKYLWCYTTDGNWDYCCTNC